MEWQDGPARTHMKSLYHIKQSIYFWSIFLWGGGSSSYILVRYRRRPPCFLASSTRVKRVVKRRRDGMKQADLDILILLPGLSKFHLLVMLMMLMIGRRMGMVYSWWLCTNCPSFRSLRWKDFSQKDQLSATAQVALLSSPSCPFFSFCSDGSSERKFSHIFQLKRFCRVFNLKDF